MENKGGNGDGRPAMTREEFKNWLKGFDTDQDGKISRVELVSAIRTFGGWFQGVRAWWNVRAADSDGSGYIDEHEVDNLVDFAQNYFGIRVSLH
ncbi:conserved hypothetical protein [Ricinus communis]|uniref:EF-hand domain-containing protein n=1 Tax=Ricinus communis TaxID=3988 RepID=B9R7E2_RICCO|nr:conserved hypothetical protein [Ricinus communis]